MATGYRASLAIQRFDRTEALHDGRVRIDQVLVSQALAQQSLAGLLNGVFDAAEMPFAHYVYLRDQGDPFIAIPVFPDRIFVEQYALTRPDTGISSLEDLRGRRVAVPNYFMTSSIWHRAAIEEKGISLDEIEWFTTMPERDKRMQLPSEFPVTYVPCPHPGTERLLDKTVDCLLTEAFPALEPDRVGEIVPFLDTSSGAQIASFERNPVHAIVHVIAIRAEVASRHPELVKALCAGFDRAKELAYRILQNERNVSLPLMRPYLDETVRVFGEDPWPYGVTGRNHDEIDAFLQHAHHQGFTTRRLAVEELFDETSIAYEWKARMPIGADLSGMESLLGLSHGL